MRREDRSSRLRILAANTPFAPECPPGVHLHGLSSCRAREPSAFVTAAGGVFISSEVHISTEQVHLRPLKPPDSAAVGTCEATEKEILDRG